MICGLLVQCIFIRIVYAWLRRTFCIRTAVTKHGHDVAPEAGAPFRPGQWGHSPGHSEKSGGGQVTACGGTLKHGCGPQRPLLS